MKRKHIDTPKKRKSKNRKIDDIPIPNAYQVLTEKEIQDLEVYMKKAQEYRAQFFVSQ